MPTIDLIGTQKELQWLEKKLAITSGLQASQNRTVKRGEVYLCEFGHNLGSELRGIHPCVIVQNDSSAPNSYTVCAVPITHAAGRMTIPPSLVPITRQTDANGLVIEGYANVSQVKCISKGRLTKPICTLPVQDIQAIDKQLASVIGIYNYYLDVEKKLETATKRAEDKETKIKALREYLSLIEKNVSGDNRQVILDLVEKALNL
ncbi:MAG: type II toxin-antitoxin system PemK/MazF family toxin [Clostridia bacterium]|nr:type II toxin-antitoxin system PemK/MazF family toxin [Clostridia bacterium]